MTNPPMTGRFRLANQQRADLYDDPWMGAERRVRAIIASIQEDVGLGGTATVRMIIDGPEELFRIEVDLPEMAYQRTTILTRDALETLLEETPEQLLEERFTFRGRP
jgi:hypothetical protein